jgi:N-acyl amino acid synthase of PEP-CTERM/exosortase system
MVTLAQKLNSPFDNSATFLYGGGDMIEFNYQRVEKGDSRLADIYRLRYQVYCMEWGFEKPQDYPGGMEFNVYDDRSVHFCAYVKQTGEVIGTVRIVLPYKGQKFPIEEHCTIEHDLKIPANSKFGEISRLAISKDFRRRLIDQALYSEKEVEMQDSEACKKERRRHEMEIVAGLYQCIFTETTKRGLTHWYAGMAKGLYYLMKRWHIIWEKAGPEVDYHGLRRPYIADFAKVGKHLKEKNPYITQRPVGWID